MKLIIRGVFSLRNNFFFLSGLIKNGFVAYDSGLKGEFLVITGVLCFLGDSAMHAEITNTPNPGVSLNPCQMCHLNVDKKVDKASKNYVWESIGLK